MDKFDSKLFLQRIAEDMIPMHNMLGLELLEVKEGFVSLRLPFDKKLIGDILNKRIHGGIISAVMDAAGGAVAILNFRNVEDQLSTINMQVNYLLPTTQKDLIFEARNIKVGTRVIFTEMKTYHVGAEDKIIATASAAYSFKPK